MADFIQPDQPETVLALASLFDAVLALRLLSEHRQRVKLKDVAHAHGSAMRYCDMPVHGAHRRQIAALCNRRS
jgi:hypothetical protein